MPQCKVLPLWRGQVLSQGDGIYWQDSSGALPDDAIFLAQMDERPYFAINLPEEDAPEGPEPVELRARMSLLEQTEAALIATALGCANWHRTHSFCGCCGAPTQSTDSGWRRSCAACGHDSFPRTDPVVIMLVTQGDNVLLGRSPAWPEGMYSLLAGFMEPGETIEAAVARETFEEVGITCTDIGYLGSQPWPFPGTLMVGCRARATQTALNPDPEEIADALWVSRKEMLDVVAGIHPHIKAPREGAIAGMILKNWVAGRID